MSDAPYRFQLCSRPVGPSGSHMCGACRECAENQRQQIREQIAAFTVHDERNECDPTLN